MSEGVTKRNAGLLWEAFSYEQFSPDTSDALRGNAALDAPRPLVDRGAYASAGDAERRGLAPTQSVGAMYICRFP